MEIVLVVCLLADPSKCKEQRLEGVVETSDPGRCAVASVPYMAEWMNGHPAYKLVSWRCAKEGEQSL
jgi:hypothetical protein